MADGHEIRAQIDNEAHKYLIWIAAGSAATLFSFYKDIYVNNTDPELAIYLAISIVIFIIVAWLSLLLFRLRRAVSLRFAPTHKAFKNRWVWSKWVWNYWYFIIFLFLIGYVVTIVGMLNTLH